MSVTVGSQVYIVPLLTVVESMRPQPEHIKSLGGDSYLLWVRDQYWPVLCLHQVVDIEPLHHQLQHGIVMLLESNQCRFALFVDQLLGQQQVVIKSLEQHYRRVPGVSGATILGDGSVALILDTEALAKISRSKAEQPEVHYAN